MNYARRQQYRRLSHAGKAGLGSVIAALFGLVIASAEAAALAGLLLLAAVGLGLYARHWLSLDGRSRVGARSEDEVQRVLAPLEAEGWRLGTRCRGRAGEISTRWRSPRPAWRSRSRPRPGPTTSVISFVCATRRRGCGGAGEDGPAAGRRRPVPCPNAWRGAPRARCRRGLDRPAASISFALRPGWGTTPSPAADKRNT